MPIDETTRVEGSIRTIGKKYRVVQLLGTGGMGTVYEAENEWTGRHVAIKLLRPELTAAPNIVRRFTQEAQAAAKIRHEQIVDVLDMGRDSMTGSFFIVQELLEGEDLGAWLRAHGRMDAREAFALIVPVMDALAAAHEKGIVHRDIKPDNIFLARTTSGEISPKLIDFGISKLSDTDDSVKLTSAGIAIGTPEYMSPEQARGDDTLDARTDIWSLGVVLYELVSGTIPYEEKNYNLVVSRVLTEPVPPILSRVPDLAPSIAAIIHRALARDRDERYPNVQAMLRDILSCSDLGIAARAEIAVRFGARMLDASQSTAPTLDPAPAHSSMEVTREPAIDRDENAPNRPFVPSPRPPLTSFVAAAILSISVIVAAAIPRAVKPHAVSPSASLATATVPSNMVHAAQSPRVSAMPTERVPDVGASAAETRETPPLRSVTQPSRESAIASTSTRAHAGVLPPEPRAEALVAEPRAEARTTEPTTVIPLRALAPTSVVHRHHIVVE